MTETIERTLELDASPADVWRALTDPTEVSGWFGDSAQFEPKVGTDGWFGWEKHGRYAMRVEVFDPPTRFAWSWSHEADAPFDGATSTLVEWTVVPRGDGGTTLKLKESGFARDEHRQENSDGWTEELTHLAAYLEAG